MDMKDLESAVRELIEQIYEAKYTRPLYVKELQRWDGSLLGYKLILPLNKDERPIELAMEGKYMVRYLIAVFVFQQLQMKHIRQTSCMWSKRKMAPCR